VKIVSLWSVMRRPGLADALYRDVTVIVNVAASTTAFGLLQGPGYPNDETAK